jgi:hypothetical protein
VTITTVERTGLSASDRRDREKPVMTMLLRR